MTSTGFLEQFHRNRSRMPGRAGTPLPAAARTETAQYKSYPLCGLCAPYHFRLGYGISCFASVNPSRLDLASP